MSRRVRELVRGGGGRLGREGECCCRAAEGRRDDDMLLAGSSEMLLLLLLLRSPYAVNAGRFHLLVQARGAGLWLRKRMQTRRLALLGPIRHLGY